MRAKGHEVVFLCATDEHGTPAELAAKEQKTSPEAFCREMWQIQKNISSQFSLSFDFFGRSSSESNHKLTQEFAAALYDQGLIKEVEENQLYSEKDGRFLPDRYVIGTCPECSYERARGDQCENCTKQLHASELIEPRSVLSESSKLELRKTKHLYLMQSKLQVALKKWIDEQKDWPILTTSIAKKWLTDGEGLQDRSITRDLDWGIPVTKNGAAWPGMENKVFYVWFDAPIAYISATVDWGKAQAKDPNLWKTWWLKDHGASDVFYVQFMAKDNIPFHTLSFPATLIGSKKNWKLVDYIKGFNWLTYEGGKFSTSQKRGLFMNDAVNLFPSDYWRWWLLSNAPETSDSDFTWSSFQTCINKDLSDVLGNFVSRLIKFSRSKFGDEVPLGNSFGKQEEKTAAIILEQLKAFEDAMQRMEVRKSAGLLRKIWSLGNEYLQISAPWVLIKSDIEEAKKIVRFGFNLLNLYGDISKPFIPDTSIKIKACLQKTLSDSYWPKHNNSIFQQINGGDKFSIIDNLFCKISEEESLELETRFRGS
jgi:methionyl-tRNA synthetase